jgi:uncharacterized protein (TIGR00369 family)
MPANPALPASADPTARELARWMEQEREVRMAIEAGAGFGVAPQRGQESTGLAFMQAMMRGEVPAPPISRTLDFLLVEVEAGRAVFQGTPQEAHYNPLGGVHGGWFATLLDSALGCAVHTVMPPGRAYTTAELHVNLVRGLSTRVPRVRAEGRVLHAGRQLATAEARLVGPDGTLYAHGSTTCLVFDTKA